MNMGYVPDQLAEIIRLPRYIVEGSVISAGSMATRCTCIPCHLETRPSAGWKRWGAWVNSLTMRLEAETTAREIRRAIAQFYVLGEEAPEGGWKHLDAAIEVSREAFTDLLVAESDSISQQDPSIFRDHLARALKDGSIKVLRGGEGEVLGFFEHFDPKPTQIVPVTIHPLLPGEGSKTP